MPVNRGRIGIELPIYDIGEGLTVGSQMQVTNNALVME